MKDIYLIVDKVRSLHNVGSFFRTSDAFGIKKIFLCGYTGTPPRKEISKVAIGAEEVVPWEKAGQAWRVVEKLKKEGIYTVALEQAKDSVSINKWKPKFPIAIIVGNELKGVSVGVLKRVDKIVNIPMLGMKENINVSVATGIILYYIRNN